MHLDCRERAPVRWYVRKLGKSLVLAVHACGCGCMGEDRDEHGEVIAECSCDACEEDGSCGARRMEARTKNAVCPACDGEGSVVNPAVDSHGLTAEDFERGDVDIEEYLGGGYDIVCPVCEGERIVRRPAEDAPKAVRAAFRAAVGRAEERDDALRTMRRERGEW